MTALIGIPTWAIGVIVGFGLLLWWMVEYAVRLRRSLTPKLSIGLGGIVTTPVKEKTKSLDLKTGLVTTKTDEYQAVYLRGVVVAESEKAVSHCMAYLTGVRKKDKTTLQYTATQYLDDIQLPWSYIGREAITIPKGVRRYFDILDVHERRMRPDPCGVWPLTLRKLFDDHTSYRLDLLVAGDGISKSLTIEFTWAGDLKTITGIQLPDKTE